MENNIIISKKDYLNLVWAAAELTALEQAGVDNWEGYGEYDREYVNKVVAENEKESLKTITRFEVIDHSKNGSGRELTKYDIQVSLSLQDDNRTLKVFLDDRE